MNIKILVILMTFSNFIFAQKLLIKNIDKLINPKKLEHVYYKNDIYGIPKANLFKDELGRTLVFYQASFGGVGEHTENILKIFEIQKNSSKKLFEDGIEFVKFIEKGSVLKDIKGKYIINLCDVCDGWDTALENDVFFVPVEIDIKSMKLNVDLSNEEKKKLIQSFDKQSKKNLKEQLSYGNKEYKKYILNTKKYILDLLEM